MYQFHHQVKLAGWVHYVEQLGQAFVVRFFHNEDFPLHKLFLSQVPLQLLLVIYFYCQVYARRQMNCVADRCIRASSYLLADLVIANLSEVQCRILRAVCTLLHRCNWFHHFTVQVGVSNVAWRSAGHFRHPRPLELTVGESSLLLIVSLFLLSFDYKHIIRAFRTYWNRVKTQIWRAIRPAPSRAVAARKRSEGTSPATLAVSASGKPA